MELKDFIQTTLEQIIEGVSNAQSSVKGLGGSINPTTLSFTKDGHINRYEHAMPQEVIFDIGLTSIEKNGSTEGIGVFLGSFNLGKKNNEQLESAAITKVRFTVPLVLPDGEKLAKPLNNKVHMQGL